MSATRVKPPSDIYKAWLHTCPAPATPLDILAWAVPYATDAEWVIVIVPDKQGIWVRSNVDGKEILIGRLATAQQLLIAGDEDE